jgi:hypothetical protein
MNATSPPERPDCGRLSYWQGRRRAERMLQGNLPAAVRLFILAMTVLLVGCGPSGPASTRTNSSAFATLAERTKFLNEYVTFRRTYETLDFDIMYQDNSSFPPAPSDWGLALVATVPASELQAWIPPGVKASAAPDTAWLKSVPTKLDLSGVREWYVGHRRIVGIDSTRRIVVYEISSI